MLDESIDLAEESHLPICDYWQPLSKTSSETLASATKRKPDDKRSDQIVLPEEGRL